MAPALATVIKDDPDFFIPIRIVNISPKGLLKTRVYIDLFDMQEAEATKRLLDGVKRNVNRKSNGFPFKSETSVSKSSMTSQTNKPMGNLWMGYSTPPINQQEEKRVNLLKEKLSRQINNRIKLLDALSKTRDPIDESCLEEDLEKCERTIIDFHVVYDFAKKLIGYLQSREAHIRKVIVREFLSSPHDLVSEKEIFIPINFNETIKDLGFENIVVNNKIQDIFDFCDATVIETKDDEDCFLQFRNLYSHARNSLIFLNLGDFDYNAHLGNIEGCLNTLSKVDLQLSRVRQQLATSDYLLITSDHGVSYDSSSLSFSHLKECTLFLLSNRNTIFYHPGIVLGHELVFDTVQAIQKSRKLSSLGFERIGD